MRRLPAEIVALVALALPASAAEPKTAVLEVGGMNCSLCPITVRKALEQVPGVIEARVEFESKRAHARYDPEKATPQKLAKAVTDAGFPARVKEP